MKTKSQLSKEDIEKVLEDIVTKNTSLSFTQEGNSFFFKNDKNKYRYLLKYDKRYDYYLVYKVNWNKKYYQGYVLTISDLKVALNGIVRQWGR